MATRKKAVAKKRKHTLRYVGGDPAENPLFYVNNVEMIVGSFDFQIRLNRAIEVTDDEILVINQGTLAMSPQHARSLIGILASGLERYDEQFAEAPPPPVEEID